MEHVVRAVDVRSNSQSRAALAARDEPDCN
jgi:hypothetical protein